MFAVSMQCHIRAMQYPCISLYQTKMNADSVAIKLQDMGILLNRRMDERAIMCKASRLRQTIGEDLDNLVYGSLRGVAMRLLKSYGPQS